MGGGGGWEEGGGEGEGKRRGESEMGRGRDDRKSMLLQKTLQLRSEVSSCQNAIVPPPVPHANAVSLLESGEQRYIKAITTTTTTLFIRIKHNMQIFGVFPFIIQYNFIAKCQYTDCTRNVSWCQVHSSHIHSNRKTLNDNNS